MGPLGLSAKKVADDIAKATMSFKGLRVTVKLTVQNRVATVSPSNIYQLSPSRNAATRPFHEHMVAEACCVYQAVAAVLLTYSPSLADAAIRSMWSRPPPL